MAFLEALGRSGRLPALTKQISDIPANELAMEQGKLALETGKTNLAIGKLQFAEMQRKQEALSRPIPISLLRNQFRDKEAADLAQQIATDLGAIKTTPSGEQYTTIADIPDVIKMMEQPGYIEKFSKISINGAKSRIAQIQTAMQNVKKPEELQGLQQQLNQAQLEYNAAVQRDAAYGKMMDRLHDLETTGKFTPESLEEFLKTGDESVVRRIEGREEPAKTAIAEYIRTHPDASSEDIAKYQRSLSTGGRGASKYDKNIHIAAQAAGIDPRKIVAGKLTQEEAIKVADEYQKRFGTQSLLELLLGGDLGGDGSTIPKYDAEGNRIE